MGDALSADVGVGWRSRERLKILTSLNERLIELSASAFQGPMNSEGHSSIPFAVDPEMASTAGELGALSSCLSLTVECVRVVLAGKGGFGDFRWRAHVLSWWG